MKALTRRAAAVSSLVLSMALATSFSPAEPPPPENLQCKIVYTWLVEVSWTNPVAYDSLRIRKRIPSTNFESDEYALPRGTTRAVMGAQGDDVPVAETLYEVRGVIDAEGPSAAASGHPFDPPKLPFVRGDANRDGTVSISDVATMERSLFIGEWDGYLLRGGRMPPCMEAADADDSDVFNISDSVFTLLALFLGGPVFPEPFPLAAADEREGSLSCAEPQGPAPRVSEDFVIEVGSVQAVPGAVVSVPVYATTPVEIDAFSLALRFDPAALQIEEATLEGTATEAMHVTEGGFKSDFSAPGSGQYLLGIMNNFVKDVRLPPLHHELLVNLTVRVLDEAAPGFTEIVPEENGAGDPPVRNEFSVLGSAVYAATYPKTLKGVLKIGVPENVDFFRRGDANGDGKRDIADPIATLGHLFLGSGPLACQDAADADDDGRLMITDAIAMLGSLFLGSPASLPEPFAACGSDPTEDALPCIRQACP